LSLLSLFLVASLFVDAAETLLIKKYDGDKVIRFYIQNEYQAEMVHMFVETNKRQVDVWSHQMRIGTTFDIHISADLLSDAKSLGVGYEIFIDDLQAEIDREQSEQALALAVLSNKAQQIGDDSFFTAYQQLDDIQTFLQTLAANYSTIAQYVEIGTSIQNRPIFGLQIGGVSSSTKPGVFFNGGQHAREWISPATVTYMLWSLVTQYDSDPTIKSLVDYFSWTLVPVANPDGYTYTQTERMWRKNRRKDGNCYGVDNNRNWDNHWDQGGSSNQPCDETYCGTGGFSEPEETAIAHYVGNATNMQFYIDFHSYSQLWMTPWGWTSALPKDYKAQLEGAHKATAALSALYGTQYTDGAIYTTIYEATGSSVDWVYGNANVKYSYAVELRDQGQHGFLLPANQIIPSGKETLAGVVALAQYVQSQLGDNVNQ